MTKTSLLWTLLAVLLVATPQVTAGERGAWTPEDLWKFKRVVAFSLHPDRALVAYQVTETELRANRTRSHLRIVGTDGEGDRRITNAVKGSDSHPLWSPDGGTLAFLSTRQGGNQLHLLPFADGGEARRITTFPGGIDDFMFTPDGSAVVFAARTWPDCKEDLACIRRLDKAVDQTKVSAKIHEHLLYRHWDTYEDGKVQHLFRLSLEDGRLVDLTPGLKWDALTFWLASAGREFDVSPDGKWVYFSGNQDDDQAVSYDYQIYRVPATGGEAEAVTDNPASDMLPRVSPDGRTLAWRASRRPGYESDRYELMVRPVEGGEVRSLTADMDRSVAGFFWGPRGRFLYFHAEDKGDYNLYRVGKKGEEITPVLDAASTGRGYHLATQMARSGKFFVYMYRTIDRYYELYRADNRGRNPQPLTKVNADLYASYHMPGAAEVWFEGAEGAQVHGFVIKPRNFDPEKRYPLMVRIHGGPQQMFGYAFRHEYAIFSGAGYFVFFCNPRGSTGYGQAFTDGVRGDWGGKPIEDLKSGVRHVLAEYPAIDPKRVGAWGGSYGGYVVNWLQGHNDDGLFAALVSHAGSVDRWSAYGNTEELWFPEWEMHGPPWERPDMADRWSPIRYAKNFGTPQLITHGDLDYRVRVTGGEVMFTALQRLGVDSKMIRFPDEDHWILKPHNKQFWYQSILDWFDTWLKGPEELKPSSQDG